MSHLIALVFDDPHEAKEAGAALHRMVSEGLLDVQDAVLIGKKPDGKIVVSQEDKVIGGDRKTGHVAGLIAGAVTGTLPFPMSGTLAGRLISRLMDHGITHKFVKDLKQEVQPGTSALLLLGAADPERRQRIEERMNEFGAKVLTAHLPAEILEQIESEIERQKAA
jgi:uncharacterized membrane protein